MDFEEALSYLLSLGHETLAIKLGLRNTELLLAALRNPQTCYAAVQIAGTNGKGSTAVVLDSICRAAGIRTGLYTSPHLVTITERVKIDGEEISRENFARLVTVVRATAQRLVDQGRIEALPTFFEHVTAIAFLAFKEAAIDISILETGLGGRLDSTTAARAETVAITPIALDHQEHLGNTIAEIAAEKAAIIRPGVTAIVAPQSREALSVILKQCASCNVTPFVNDCATATSSVTEDGRIRATFTTPGDVYENVLLGLRGRYQLSNVSTAIRLAESLRERGFPVPPEAVVKGIEQARNPARLELLDDVRPRLLLDGAHNPAGARALREYLDEFVGVPITLVFGAMRDKNLKEMAETLFPAAQHLLITQPDNPRAASPETLLGFAARIIDVDRITIAPSVSEALRKAREQTPEHGLICIAGSLYLIGEVKRQLRGLASAQFPNTMRPSDSHFLVVNADD